MLGESEGMKQDDPLRGHCVSCANFRPGYQRGVGACSSSDYFKLKTGHSFRRGAPEGPSVEVRKLDGCKFWMGAW